ncbi:MAG: PstS family phosphate ABC transporter substrate-binding protein, partial [Candidatus Omnitrophota bacterium]
MNRIMKVIAALAAVLNLSMGAQAAIAAENITVKGSDTILVLGQKWAEEYMKQHPDVSIQVTGGGSGVGIAALINGTTTIANASRQIKTSEVEKAQKAGYYPAEFAVALDTLAVIVNAQSPIKELTVKQLMGIYTGKINNWKEVGGDNQMIIRYGRESSSGTYQFFKEFILKNQDFSADCQTLQGTSAVTNAVSKDPSGICYGGAAYFLNQ